MVLTIFVLLSVSVAIQAMTPFNGNSRFGCPYKGDAASFKTTNSAAGSVGNLPSFFVRIRNNPKVSSMDKRDPGTFLNWALSSFSPWQSQNIRPYITYRLPGSNRPISFVATMGKRRDHFPRMVNSFERLNN